MLRRLSVLALTATFLPLAFAADESGKVKALVVKLGAEKEKEVMTV